MQHPKIQRDKSMKPFSINLPKSNTSDDVVVIDDVHSMVIIGANGSGKTRLGHWLENNQDDDVFVHRIAAQKMLEMEPSAFAMNYDEAMDGFLFGSTSKRMKKKNPKHGRWGDDPVVGTLWDFDSVQSLLYAEEDRRNRQYVKKVKKSKSKKKAPLPTSIFDILKEKWNELFPHREIDIIDSEFITKTKNGDKYSSTTMSDGERVAYYLLAQCLLVPENTVIIIDEPELHIHRSLQISLWNTIESLREDCCFVYITHDLDFAAYRETPSKLWLKSYDGEIWEWNIIPHNDVLSEEILLEILGSRKPILFIEGDKNSYDHKIYQAIYSDYLVIPRGSCTKVIESTKSLRSIDILHNCKSKGLIDRDYRSAEELLALKKHGIQTIDVAEVENLLCVEELIKYVANVQKMDADPVFNEVKKFITGEFEKEMKVQVSKKASFDVKFQLGMFDDRSIGSEGIKGQLTNLIDSVDVDGIYNNHLSEFNSYISSDNYSGILRVFNRKSLPNRISGYFDLAKNKYPEFVLRLMNSSHNKSITKILRSYAPVL